MSYNQGNYNEIVIFRLHFKDIITYTDDVFEIKTKYHNFIVIRHCSCRSAITCNSTLHSNLLQNMHWNFTFFWALRIQFFFWTLAVVGAVCPCWCMYRVTRKETQCSYGSIAGCFESYITTALSTRPPTRIIPSSSTKGPKCLNIKRKENKLCMLKMIYDKPLLICYLLTALLCYCFDLVFKNCNIFGCLYFVR